MTTDFFHALFVTIRQLRDTTLCVVAALMFCFISTAQAASTLEARVDRTNVTAGDSLTLTLRLNDTGNYSPDFSVLQKDFSVLGETSSSGMAASMGRVESWTEWQVTLIPLRSGKLTIPTFNIGGAKSTALTIQVKPASANANAEPGSGAPDGSPVTIEAVVDRDNVYVQQQLLLTVRIYQTVPLDDMNISEPEFDNATVRKIAQDKFRRDVNGTVYQIHELTYAIFPQQAGELTIPELVFTATEISRPRAMFDFGSRGQPVRKLSQQIAVKVKPIPAQFSGKNWLPARNLTIQETWGGNPETIAVGSSITRTIAIQADGAMAAQLPALELPTLQQARLYADQPALDDQADASGMHGVRKESAALIPARAGALELPEIQVHWWDLDSDSEKVATLAAQTLQVKAGTAATAPTTVEPHTQPRADSPQPAPATTSPPAAIDAAPQPLWMAISALLAIGWLVTFGMYWRLRRERARADGAPTQPAPAQQDLLAPVFDACRRHDAQTACTALGKWLRHEHPQTPTIEQWQAQLDDDETSRALACCIERLQRHAYRDQDAAWSGDELAKTLKNWRKRKHATSHNAQALPALYPS